MVYVQCFCCNWEFSEGVTCPDSFPKTAQEKSPCDLPLIPVKSGDAPRAFVFGQVESSRA